MSSYTIIRFPTAARLGAMATPLPWYRRLLRKLFGHKRKHMTANSIRFDRARKGR
jgi:hypothetical protein